MAVAASLVFVATCAQASETVNLTGFTYSSPKNVNVQIDPPGFFNFPKNYSVSAGQFTGTLNGASFTTYCLDLEENFSFNTTYSDYNIVALDSKKALDIGKLMTKWGGTVDNAHESAAFQVALWEIMYDTGSNYDLTGSFFHPAGVFSETSGNDGIRSLAQSYLSDLGAVTSFQVSLLQSVDHYVGQGRHKTFVPGTQDFLVATPTVTPVPEPSTYALMLAGLAGVGFVARRRARRD